MPWWFHKGRCWDVCESLKDISTETIIMLTNLLFPNWTLASRDQKEKVELFLHILSSCSFTVWGYFMKYPFLPLWVVWYSMCGISIFYVNMTFHISLGTWKFKFWRLAKPASLSFSCSCFYPSTSIHLAEMKKKKEKEKRTPTPPPLQSSIVQLPSKRIVKIDWSSVL